MMPATDAFGLVVIAIFALALMGIVAGSNANKDLSSKTWGFITFMSFGFGVTSFLILLVLAALG